MHLLNYKKTKMLIIISLYILQLNYRWERLHSTWIQTLVTYAKKIALEFYWLMEVFFFRIVIFVKMSSSTTNKWLDADVHSWKTLIVLYQKWYNILYCVNLNCRIIFSLRLFNCKWPNLWLMFMLRFRPFLS